MKKILFFQRYAKNAISFIRDIPSLIASYDDKTKLRNTAQFTVQMAKNFSSWLKNVDVERKMQFRKQQ